MDFSSKVAVVTGGANGMGEAVVRTLAAEGASVVIADKDEARTELVAEDVRKAGSDVLGITMDVREEDQVQNLIKQVIDRYGRIDILDNNAAALELAREDPELTELSTEILTETIRVNLMGPFFMCKYVIPHMVSNGGGSIINMASITGLTGEPVLTAYGISKSGVIQLTRTVGAQYGKAGVRCNAIAPGLVMTPNNKEYYPAENQAIYERHSMTTYVGEPQDVANIVVFLASDESRYMTGHVVYADGGITAVNPILADMRGGGEGGSRE